MTRELMRKDLVYLAEMAASNYYDQKVMSEVINNVSDDFEKYRKEGILEALERIEKASDGADADNDYGEDYSEVVQYAVRSEIEAIRKELE